MASPRSESTGGASQPAAAGTSLRRRRSRPEQLRLAGEILAAYASSRKALRSAPIADAVTSLRAEFPDLSAAPNTLSEARRLGHAVTRTLTFVPGDTRCLARSLVLTRLLAKRGIAAKLVIGARTSPAFLAHAWVEFQGQPVLDPGDGSFARLVEL
jgi:hypothetical protein